MNLSAPVTSLPYVGEKYERLLKKLEIETVENLLHHYPSRYEDFSVKKPIASLVSGDRVTVVGTVADFRLTITNRKLFNIQEAALHDATGSLKLIWFNQPFLRESIRNGVALSVAGTVESDGGKLLMKNPEYEVGKGNSSQGDSLQGVSFSWPFSWPRLSRLHTGRLVPIYPETAGISSKWLRSKIAMLLGFGPYGGKFSLLPILQEWVPLQILREHTLLELHQTIRSIHFPSSMHDAQLAKRRLAMDELVTLQLAALERKKKWQTRQRTEKMHINKNSVNQFITRLPFHLTNDQRRAIDEILAGLSRQIPMNRLLEGDVGSGKTIVAAVAAYAVIRAGFQVAFMAPTQVLADQHAGTLRSFLEPLGVRIKLITGETKRATSDQRLTTSGEKQYHLLIGTHALIYDRAKELIDQNRLALVIIDEQHRFGVSQRAQLVGRGVSPHILSMTATPIPRTVALTLFGDLDLSILHEKPTGRLPVKTWVVPEVKRASGYEWIKTQVEDGAQTFVVCPFIDPSESDTVKTVKATTEEFRKLKDIFTGYRLSMLHGRMPAKEKTKVLLSMKQHDIDILVTTPVVEVGVDIPDATIMMIEGAERFGLAQLHQLRGRVGRRNKPSYCLLFTTEETETTRLKVMEGTENGMLLAEMDLKHRGPGSLWGTKQHGWPTLRVADLTDSNMVQEAHQLAQELSSLPSLQPIIEERIKPHLDKQVTPN